MNEMIKASNEEILELYMTLFNKIIKEETYPSNWNTSLTQVIHKEGNKDDPSNYRGIALTSNLSKLFNSILDTRITKYLEDTNTIRPEQGGFRKDHRTSDHIFILQTIIKKYTRNRGKLYGCFVDLKKAYDSVWRRGLIHKLEESGINPQTVNLIEDMYKKTYTSVIYNKHILPEIQTKRGVKQGDNLSPLLFNIYINDLPKEIEKGETHPIKLFDHNINCLMWADDIILLSETKEGLQNCLNNLNHYCKKWKLNANIQKTKIMVFREKGIKVKNEHFYLGNLQVMATKEYTYLGITINTSGHLKTGIDNLIDRARRAWFAILRILWKSKKRNIDTYITLFNNVIKPIALYSCEIWSMTENLPNDIENIHTSTYERFQTRCCKNILGVNNKTTNITTLAELGKYPLYIDIHKKMIKYFLRLQTLKKERLLYKAYIEQKNGLKNKDTNWLSKIKDILDKTGFSFVFDMKKTKNSGENPNIDIKLTHEIEQRSKEIFEQQALYHIEERGNTGRGKLVFYSTIKREYKRELYLQMQNIKYRNAIRNLRLSTHKLNIETGRHKGIDRDERLCKLCTLNRVETEIHFLTECPTFTDERTSFIHDINTKTNLHTKQMDIKLIKDISLCKNMHIINMFGKYVSTCFEKRKGLKSQTTPKS